VIGQNDYFLAMTDCMVGYISENTKQREEIPMQTLNLDEQEMVAGGYRPFDRNIFLGKIAIDLEAIRRAIGLTIRGPGAVNFNIGRSLGSLVVNFQQPMPTIFVPANSSTGRDENC